VCTRSTPCTPPTQKTPTPTACTRCACPPGNAYRGRPLSALPRDGVVITALVGQGQRRLQPAADTCIEDDDTLVLFDPPAALARAEARLQ